MPYIGPYIPEDYEIEEMFAQLTLARGEVSYNATNVAVGDALPNDSVIVALCVRVETPWDVPASMTIGNNSDSDLYVDADSIDLNQEGLYMIDVYGITLGTSTINAYINAPGAVIGKATVFAVVRVG